MSNSISTENEINTLLQNGIQFFHCFEKPISEKEKKRGESMKKKQRYWREFFGKDEDDFFYLNGAKVF